MIVVSLPGGTTVTVAVSVTNMAEVSKVPDTLLSPHVRAPKPAGRRITVVHGGLGRSGATPHARTGEFRTNTRSKIPRHSQALLFCSLSSRRVSPVRAAWTGLCESEPVVPMPPTSGDFRRGLLGVLP